MSTPNPKETLVTTPQTDPLHKMHCLACRGICANCTNLTHSHEDGAAYCKANHGWWITLKIQTCQWFEANQPADLLDK